MSVTRQFYPVLGVFAGPTPATGYHFTSGNSGVSLLEQLQRVQTTTDSFNIERTDVVQYGQLAAISREIITAPTAPLSLSYLIADLSNERKLGFYVSGDSTALLDILTKVSDEKNYFIAYAPQGRNFFGYTGQSKVIQITNGFISNYSVSAAVGGFPTATVDIEGSNWAVSSGSHFQDLRAVNVVNGNVISGLLYSVPVGISGLSDTVAVIRPEGIKLTIAGAKGVVASDLKIQSFDLGVALTRDQLQELGKRFSTSKEIQFPLSATLAVTANLGDLEEADVAGILCNDESYTLFVNLHDPTCVGEGDIAVQYKLVGAKIDSQEISDDVGSIASTITINYSAPIGSDTDVNGIYMSGRAW